MDPSGKKMRNKLKKSILSTKIYKLRNSIMNTFVFISIIEILCLEFSIGFKVLSETLARITLVISYAIFTSYIFYVINILIPNKIEQKHRTPIISLKIFYLVNTLKNFIKNILGEESYSYSISEDKLCEVLDKRQNIICSDICEHNRKHALVLIGQINVFHIYLDAKIFKLINDIEFSLMHLGFNYIIEDKTFGQTYNSHCCKLISKVAELISLTKDNEEIIQNEYGIGNK